MKRPRLAWALSVVIVLGLGAALLDGALVHHRALAGPLAIARALAHALTEGTLVLDVRATVARALGGVLLGALVAVPLGVASGRSQRAHGALEPTLDFLRAIPPLLVLPLVLLALGYGEISRVAIVAWASALGVSLHLGAASARSGGERDRALRVMGASRWQRFLWVELPELAPPGLVALRHALSLGLVVTIVTEMVIGAEHGLGARALEAQIAYDTPTLYALLLVTGALGWLFARVLLTLERHTQAWSGAERPSGR